MNQIKAKKLQTLKDRLVGLLDNDLNVVYFETRFGIHTFCMKNCIQVIILDNNDYIVRSKVIAPNRVFFWPPQYNKVVEIRLTSNEHRINLKVGDKVTLLLN